MNTNIVSEHKKVQFMEELASQLPVMDQQIREIVVDLFVTQGGDAELFSHAIYEIGMHHEYKPKIIQIATLILSNDKKRKAEESKDEPQPKRLCIEMEPNQPHALSLQTLTPHNQHEAADAFFEHFECMLNKADPDFGNMVADFIILLSSNNRSIASKAWGVLSKLKDSETLQAFFCEEEMLNGLLHLLEKFAEGHQREHFSDPDSSMGPQPLREIADFPYRCIDLLLSLKSFQKVEIILEALSCLIDFSLKYQRDSKIKFSFAEKQMAPLMALLHGENDQIAIASLNIQNKTDWGSKFVKKVQVKDIKKNVDKALYLLRRTNDERYMGIIIDYLKKVWMCFQAHASFRLIFDALPHQLLSLAENGGVPLVAQICIYFSKIDDIHYRAAFREAGGLKRMQVLLKNYNRKYQAALHQQKEQIALSQAEDKRWLELLEKIVLSSMLSLSKNASSFDEAFAQSQGEIYIEMLKQQPSIKITRCAAIHLATQSKNAKENFKDKPHCIGALGVPLLVELLMSTNNTVVEQAVWALTTVAWNLENKQYLLNTKAFDTVKVLLQNPQGFPPKAVQLWAFCIEGKGKIDDVDTQVICEALGGAEPFFAVVSLNLLLSVDGFPQDLGRKVIEVLTYSLLQSKENRVRETAYWCLGKLTKLGLMCETNYVEIIKGIEILFNTEEVPSSLIEGACFYLSETLSEMFKNTNLKNGVLCLISRCFNIKYPRVQETAIWLSHKFACEFPSDLFHISHFAYSKGMELMGSSHEAVARGGMWLTGKLCPLTYNYDLKQLQKTIPPLLQWLKKGDVKTRPLALRVLGTMFVNCKNIGSFALNEGVHAELLGLLAEIMRQPLHEVWHETLLWVILSLLPFKESALLKQALGQLLNENSIMRFLKSKNPKINEAIIFILGYAGSHSTFNLLRDEAIQLIWPSPQLKDQNAQLYSFSLKALARLFTGEEIVAKLQNREVVSKQDFLLTLSIGSSLVESIPANLYISPFSTNLCHFKDMYGKSQYADVKLEFDDNTFLDCHKMVLGTQCTYFESMFSQKMKEAEASVIKIKEVDPEVGKKFIRFLYEQQYDFTSTEDAFSMLKLANQYLVGNLEEACVRFLVSKLTKETAEEIYTQALQSPCIQLVKRIRYWMIHYYLMLPEALQLHIQDDEEWLEFYQVLVAQVLVARIAL